jgi:hypothetical protein
MATARERASITQAADGEADEVDYSGVAKVLTGAFGTLAAAATALGIKNGSLQQIMANAVFATLIVFVFLAIAVGGGLVGSLKIKTDINFAPFAVYAGVGLVALTAIAMVSGRATTSNESFWHSLTNNVETASWIGLGVGVVLLLAFMIGVDHKWLISIPAASLIVGSLAFFLGLFLALYLVVQSDKVVNAPTTTLAIKSSDSVDELDIHVSTSTFLRDKGIRVVAFVCEPGLELLQSKCRVVLSQPLAQASDGTIDQTLPVVLGPRVHADVLVMTTEEASSSHAAVGTDLTVETILGDCKGGSNWCTRLSVPAPPPTTTTTAK